MVKFFCPTEKPEVGFEPTPTFVDQKGQATGDHSEEAFGSSPTSTARSTSSQTTSHWRPKVNVQSDNTPLETIVEKPLAVAPPQLQGERPDRPQATGHQRSTSNQTTRHWRPSWKSPWQQPHLDCKVNVQSEHKPGETIIKKPVPAAPPRQQGQPSVRPQVTGDHHKKNGSSPTWTAVDITTTARNMTSPSFTFLAKASL